MHKESTSVLKLHDDGHLTYNHQVIAATLTISDEDWETRLKKEYQICSLSEDILKNSERHPAYKTDNDLILYEGMIWVPPTLRKELIRRYHEDHPHGQQGVDKTLERIKRTYSTQEVVQNIFRDSLRALDGDIGNVVLLRDDEINFIRRAHHLNLLSETATRATIRNTQGISLTDSCRARPCQSKHGSPLLWTSSRSCQNWWNP